MQLEVKNETLEIKQDNNKVIKLLMKYKEDELLTEGEKKIIHFLFNPNATPKSCGMSEKQFYFCKKHPEKYIEMNLLEKVLNKAIKLADDYNKYKLLEELIKENN